MICLQVFTAERMLSWDGYELPIAIEILFGKIVVRGPRKCELVRKQASANDLRHLT